MRIVFENILKYNTHFRYKYQFILKQLLIKKALPINNWQRFLLKFILIKFFLKRYRY